MNKCLLPHDNPLLTLCSNYLIELIYIDDFLKEAERIKFFMVPADAHINEQLEGLSDKCLRLYGAMLSRLSLAEKMGLKDGNDNVYIIFPQKDIARILGISLKSASNFMVALCDNGLICKKKMGQGNPDRIYVNNCKR